MVISSENTPKPDSGSCFRKAARGRAPLFRRFWLFVKAHPLLFAAICILCAVTALSLLAGLVHGLLSEQAPEHSLRTATAIAAMAVTQIGFGISDAAHLARLESGVSVRPLTEQ